MKQLFKYLKFTYLVAICIWFFYIGLNASYIKVLLPNSLNDTTQEAKPYIPTEQSSELDKFLYSDTIYNIIGVYSTLSTFLGLLITGRGRNLFEKFTLLSIFALPRERNYWGKVKDKSTGEPIPFSTLRILKIEDNEEVVVAQTIADLDGRYRLYLNKNDGSYILEVKNSGYQTFRQDIKRWFMTENNEIKIDVSLEKLNVHYSKIREFYDSHKNGLYNTLIFYTYIVSLLTFFHATYSLIAHFNFISVVDMIFFGFAAPWNTFVLLERKKFRPGKIIDYTNNSPLKNVNIEVYKKDKKLLSALSDENGIVKFNLEPGMYSLKIAKEGYELIDGENNYIDVNINEKGYLKHNIILKTNHLTTAPALDLMNPFS